MERLVAVDWCMRALFPRLLTGRLDRPQQVVHVLLVFNLVLMPFQQSQNQLVEEGPLVFEKVVEERPHVLTRYDRCEEAEDPLAGVDVGAQVQTEHPSVQLWQIRLQQDLYQGAVHEESSELGTVDLLHVTFGYK